MEPTPTKPSIFFSVGQVKPVDKIKPKQIKEIQAVIDSYGNYSLSKIK